jgi:anti-anti-sigma factor
MAAIASRVEIEFEQITRDVYHVKLVGDLAMNSVETLDRVLSRIFDRGFYRILVDLTALRYIASSGLGVLNAAAERARRHGGEIVLIGASPAVKHVFGLVGMTRLLQFAESEKEALFLLRQASLKP